MFEDIKKLAKKTLNYQDIVIDGNVIVDGKRKSVYETIQKIRYELAIANSILEIGSNRGFYSFYASNLIHKPLVLSFECNSNDCEIQRLIAEYYNNQEYFDNFILFNKSVDLELVNNMLSCVEFYDLCLLLSVVHWFEDKTFEDFVQHVAGLIMLSKKTVLEIPTNKEKIVKNKSLVDNWIGDGSKLLDAINEVLCKNNVKYKRTLIGHSKSYNHKNIERPIYLFEQISSKRMALGWMNDVRKRHKFEVCLQDEKVFLYKEGEKIDYTPSMNLNTMMNIGFEYPHYENVFRAILRDYDKRFKFKNIKVNDLRPWNTLYTQNGPFIIDPTSKYHKTKIQNDVSFMLMKFRESLIGMDPRNDDVHWWYTEEEKVQY